ncbi:MAG: isocitrate/isopropylmalate dehydrogenase family protein [Candidatus Dormibacteraeota bacterium]|nr:isocitrate/isopropylmalate dehydrogenase family protein [Candidatus Dormibacteraeota bacterium]MBO0705711.1 isocitrate/isopropylmalate dehydrogenase family protein [Candidatus Dormibacteraeota bacterium]MBO0762730.1 isocitrate/isopropylmalate dehydrogenase family protein [Candidatus Dormibacteraeota bacterium]
MRLLVLPGDGIGPEITDATLAVLRAVDTALGLSLELECREVGLAALAAEGTTLPESVLADARSADGIILGPVSHHAYPPPEQGGRNPSGTLRIDLDLYANLRPARSRSALPSPVGPFDLVIVRENTEGFYADRNMAVGSGEFMPTPDVALSVRKITSAGSRRVALVAFELARTRRRQVTAVHKANVLRLSEEVFLREVHAVAAEHPDVTLDEVLVDAAAAHLVRQPGRFDVMVTTNMFGDILSDEASELAGGLGLAPSLNAGDAHALAQAQHGSAPDIAGQDRANPTSLILSTAMLLRWLGSRAEDGGASLLLAADRVDAAVEAALADPEGRTADLGGPLGTRAFGERVAALVGG